MSATDPNLDRIELVAAALAPLLEHLVFVGGCAAGLLMDTSDLERSDKVIERLRALGTLKA